MTGFVFFLASTDSVALDLVKILAAAAGMVMIARYLRIGAIPAYLLSGALIGPHAIGLVASGENVQAISTLATILLMFIVGLHLDPSGLSGGMVKVLSVGVVSTFAAIVAMWPLLTSSQLNAPAALAVAIALSMSSTAVVLRILAEKRETHRLHGRLIFGTLVVQDMMALIGLAILPILATWGHVQAPAAVDGAAAAAHGASILPAEWSGWLKFVVAIGGITLLIIANRFLLPWLMREATRHASQEVPLVLSAAVALGSAVLAAGLGFSAELGAFLAGFLLAGTPFRHQLSGQLIPMRDLFMAIFFTTVGLQLDMHAFGEGGWQLILLGFISVVLIKVAAMSLVAWLFGATPAVAAIFGLAMFQAGEFSIVVLSAAQHQGLLDATMMSRLTVVVVMTLILTPAFFTLGHKLRPFASKIPVAGWSKAGALRPPTKDERAAANREAVSNEFGEHDGDHAPPTFNDHVIIAGFGVVGRSIADRLEVADRAFCIVDLNPATVETQRRLGRNAVYGDISNPEVLEGVGIEHAAAVVLTIPDDEATLRACRVIRTLSPHIFIAARTSFLSKAMAAQQLGADHVTVEEVATAETMARHVMDKLKRKTSPISNHA